MTEHKPLTTQDRVDWQEKAAQRGWETYTKRALLTLEEQDGTVDRLVDALVQAERERDEARAECKRRQS